MPSIRDKKATQQTKAQAVEEEIKTHTGFNINALIRISNKL